MMEEATHRATRHRESPAETRKSATFGHAVRLLWSSDRREITVGSTARRLWPAVQLDQIAFLYNSKGMPSAYATWAFLTPETAERLLEDPDYLLALDEWIEGEELWLIDLVAPFGDVANLVRKLRGAFFPAIDRVQAIRRHGSAARHVSLTLRPIASAAGDEPPRVPTWEDGAMNEENSNSNPVALSAE